jgi:hypothetical protein
METTEYELAIKTLAHAQTVFFLSSGNDAVAKLEQWVGDSLRRIPVQRISEALKVREILEKHVTTELPTQSGMYLKLLHGRTSVDEEMDDWGPDGPWIGPLDWFHCTYMKGLGIGFSDGIELPSLYANDSPPSPIGLVSDMIYFEGMYYGDWELQQIRA